MNTLSINAILDAFKMHNSAPLLKGIKRGIERECLRIDNGRIAQTPHPSELGSALTNKYITTDFSESLLEFITPASADVDVTMAQLHDIHRFTLENINNEQLWPLSMPCFIGDEDDIQLANYGSSNVGKMKTLYREGLKNRYGSKMQAIAGVHFNLSLPNEFWQKLQQIEGDKQALQSYISDKYFALIRNFKRELWLISYLFGASPTLCRSFLAGQKTSLPFESLSENTLYLPHATSLRLGDLGYTNSAQSSLRVTYNSLDEYLEGFKQAISMKSDLYQKFGDYTDVQAKQLNGNILQIENEFYSPIRPKRNAKPGQTPSEALCEGGVEYIEVRALDVNPFSEVGISKDQIQFLDVFLVYCVLKGSPDLSWQAQIETQTNLDLVVNRGRAPHLELSKNGQHISLKQWASEIFADLKQVALLFDEGFNTEDYSSAIAQFALSIENPDDTFSGRLLAKLKANHTESTDFALKLAKEYKSQLMSDDYTVFEQSLLQSESTESTKKQRDIELSDNQTFVDFLSDYFN